MSIAELKEFFPTGWEIVVVAVIGIIAAAVSWWLTGIGEE